MARTEAPHGYQPGRESEPEVYDEPLSAVPVEGHMTVRGGVSVLARAADYGAYFSLVLSGSERAQQVLPWDEHRKIAYLTCTGTGPVYAGSEAQCLSGKQLGFTLTSGVTLTVTHRQPVWITGDGSHSATISVAVERWEP